MADNYLENKMEEFRQGAKVVRRSGASLESLLKDIADRGLSPDVSFTGRGGSPLSAITPAQLEAVVRAGRLAESLVSGKALDGDRKMDFRYEIDETAGVIRILGPSSPRKYLFEAGQVIMAMRLKAAELHLHATVDIRPESTAPANPHLATITLSH